MSNVLVREDGLYLVKRSCGNLDIIQIRNLENGGVGVSTFDGYEEDYYTICNIDEDPDYNWIAEYPLNLEQLAINDGYNATIIKKVQDEFYVKIGEEHDYVNQD